MSTSTGHSRASGSASSGPVEVSHLPPRWEPTPVRPLLPVGVAVLSVLIALVGVVVMVSAVLYILAYLLPGIVPPQLLILNVVDPIGASVLLVFGAVLIAVATALWHQRAWALWTTVVVVFGVVAYLFFTASITVLFLVLLGLFIYLLAVRRHFY